MSATKCLPSHRKNSCRRPTGLMSSEGARRLAAKKSWGANQVPTLDMKKAEKPDIYIYSVYILYIYIYTLYYMWTWSSHRILWCGFCDSQKLEPMELREKVARQFRRGSPCGLTEDERLIEILCGFGGFFSRQNIDEKMMRNDETWWDMMRNDTDRIWSRSAESPSSESWQASYAMMPPFERAVKQAEAIQAEARKSQQWHVNNVPWLPSLHNSPYIIIYHQLSSHISILWSLDSIDRYGVDMDSMRFSPKHWRMVAIEMWILTLSSPGRCSPYQKRSRTVPEPRMPRECHSCTQWRRLSFCCSHLRLHEIYDMLIYVTYVTYVNHYHIL